MIYNMMRDPRKYEDLLRDLRKKFCSRKDKYMQVKNEIKRTIRIVGNCIEAARNAVYDKEKVDALDSLAAVYAEGIHRLRSMKDVTRPDLHNIIYVYGAIIDSGIERSLSDIGFSSIIGRQPDEVLLELRSKGGRTDMMIEMYKSAIDKGNWPRPDEFSIEFDYHPTFGPLPLRHADDHRKLKLELRI